jgi:hypothetical protein
VPADRPDKTVLDTSNIYELVPKAEVDLSRDEDNVTSLAFGSSVDGGATIYAGINSSSKDRANGKNEHFRVFILYRHEKPNKLKEVSRLQIFSNTDQDAYQRLIRFSKKVPSLGAIATAFAGKGEEIVLLDFSSKRRADATLSQYIASGQHIVGRIQLDQVAEDIDIIQVGMEEYNVIYCTKYDIFFKHVGLTPTDADPINITPAKASHERESKPTIRSIRLLSSSFAVVLLNLAGRKGAVLQVIRLPGNTGAPAKSAQYFHLPKQIRQATGLAVCNLSPPASPSDELGYAQFAIAVAGHDMSISVYTCEHQREGPVAMITRMKLYQMMNEVHPFQITGLTMSTFTPPSTISNSQIIKLGSISAGNTVVVHTISLSPVAKKALTRYILSGSGDSKYTIGPLIGYAFLAVVIAFFAQVLFEIRFNHPTVLDATNNIQPDVQRWIRYSNPVVNKILGTPAPTSLIPLPSSSSIPPIPAIQTTPADINPDDQSPADEEQSFASSLSDLLSLQALHTVGAPPIILLHDHSGEDQETNPELLKKNSVKARLHDEEVEGAHGGKTWEELTSEEKERWTERLRGVGWWAEEQVETILKGVVFGMAGAAVGDAVNGG